MKTIKQIAEEIGVSKQAIYKRISKEPLSTKLLTKLTTVDNRLTVSVDGEILIKQAFSQITDNQICKPVDESPTKNDEVVDESPTKVDETPTTFDSGIIEMLKKNINILQLQLDTKDKQIEDLSQALVAAQQTAAAAQALHAGTMKHLAMEEEKPGFIARIFGKRMKQE